MVKKLLAALVSAVLAVFLSACCCYIPLARLNAESSNYATGYGSHFVESDNSYFLSDYDNYYSSDYSYDFGYDYNSENANSDNSIFEDNSYYDNNTSEDNSSYYDNASEDDYNESSEADYGFSVEPKDEVFHNVGPGAYPSVDPTQGPFLPFAQYDD